MYIRNCSIFLDTNYTFYQNDNLSNLTVFNRNFVAPKNIFHIFLKNKITGSLPIEVDILIDKYTKTLFIKYDDQCNYILMTNVTIQNMKTK